MGQAHMQTQPPEEGMPEKSEKKAKGKKAKGNKGRNSSPSQCSGRPKQKKGKKKGRASCSKSRTRSASKKKKKKEKKKQRRKRSSSSSGSACDQEASRRPAHQGQPLMPQQQGHHAWATGMMPPHGAHWGGPMSWGAWAIPGMYPHPPMQPA